MIREDYGQTPCYDLKDCKLGVALLMSLSRQLNIPRKTLINIHTLRL